MNYLRAFQPVDIEVVRMRAHQSESTEPHVEWSVGFAPEPVEDTDETMRVVLGDLHAGGANGFADITIGALYIHQAEVGDEQLPIAVAESEATETLYDIARLHLVGILATIGAEVELPAKSPDPIVRSLRRADAESDPEAEELETTSSTGKPAEDGSESARHTH